MRVGCSAATRVAVGRTVGVRVGVIVAGAAWAMPNTIVGVGWTTGARRSDGTGVDAHVGLGVGAGAGGETTARTVAGRGASAALGDAWAMSDVGGAGRGAAGKACVGAQAACSSIASEASVGRIDSTIAKGSATASASALLSPAVSRCTSNWRDHAVSVSARCSGGKVSAAASACSVSARTAATKAGSGARPAASSACISCNRRSTWLMCQSAGAPKAYSSAAFTSSPPRLTG